MADNYGIGGNEVKTDREKHQAVIERFHGIGKARINDH